jgi:fructose-specific phosphotransferase system IIC component
METEFMANFIAATFAISLVAFPAMVSFFIVAWVYDLFTPNILNRSHRRRHDH